MYVYIEHNDLNQNFHYIYIFTEEIKATII